TARINNDVTIIDNYLSATTDFYFNNATNNQPSVSDIVWLTRRMPPQYAAEWSDGRVASGKNGDNPYGMLKYGGYNNSASNHLGGRVALNFTPVKGLKFSGVVSPNVNFFKRKVFNKQIPYYNWNDPTVFEGYLDSHVRTSLAETRNDDYNVTTQFLANYMTTLGQHDFNVLLGNENYYAFYENLGASRNEFQLTSFPYLNLGPLEFRDNSGLAYENAYRSFFGRIMYNYANKYFLQTNIRMDGSSRFHSDYRWGSFPSFSVGWVISEESFWDDIASVSFLKLRGSWGSLGNERIGNYPYQATIAFNNALFYQGGNVVSAQTAAQTQYAIQDISWEKTESSNFGFDAYLFDDRFRITADYFHKTTKDMLLPLEIPDFIGFDNPDQNTGEMETKGWEIEMGYRGNIGELNYSISANLSDFRSIMGDLGGTEFLGAQVKKKGSEFNEWYGYRAAGLFQTQEDVNNAAVTSGSVRPGDVKYVDIGDPNGAPDGLISPEYDRVLLGGSLPRYMYGGNIRLDYKGFDFLLVIQGVAKQNARLEPNMVRPLQTQNTAVPSFIDGNYWSMYNTPEQNLNARYPRLSEVTAGNNYAMSDFWLFNGSYMRLKNITLGYNFPEQLSQKLSLQNVRLYASASDLFSIDKYPQGWDPESTSSGYPIMASYIFGISVKF
ncbi:MAG TPA: SusC/RagA family TonB-linked outer membrane protein, partial [Chryseosolibacter sp.]